MILETILNAFTAVFKLLFSWLNIPALSDYNVDLSLVDTFLESGKSLINMFFPWDLVRFGLPILMIVINAEQIYHFVMWVLRKIPMLGID